MDEDVNDVQNVEPDDNPIDDSNWRQWPLPRPQTEAGDGLPRLLRPCNTSCSWLVNLV